MNLNDANVWIALATVVGSALAVLGAVFKVHSTFIDKIDKIATSIHNRIDRSDATLMAWRTDLAKDLARLAERSEDKFVSRDLFDSSVETLHHAVEETQRNLSDISERLNAACVSRPRRD